MSIYNENFNKEETPESLIANGGGFKIIDESANQLGWSVANVGNMLGLSIDPEAPGSSNTQNSRLSMQTQQLPMY